MIEFICAVIGAVGLYLLIMRILWDGFCNTRPD
jgi:hypothetical protein